MIDLDEIDHQILKLLQLDGKLSYASTGEQVGLSVSAVNERLKKLQSTGVIKGFSASVSPHAVGLGLCGFVQVLITDPSLEEGFLAEIDRLEEVQECHCITGDFSFLLKIRSKNARSFERVLREKIKSIPGVLRTNSLIALTTSKETASVPLQRVAM